MRKIRKGIPPEETWDVDEIMQHLNCDKMKARKVLDDVHNDIRDNHYGPLPKAVILDYLERKEKEEEEREAKINAITSISESVGVLREQVEHAREQVAVAREQARYAREQVSALEDQVDTTREQNQMLDEQVTSISESVVILRERNKILREQVETIKADSLAAKRKAKSATAISIISLSISGVMMLIALITLLLKL